MINDQIINAETGEVEIVTLSADEIAKREAEGLAIATLREQTEATQAAEKAALLAKLGITEDEAKLLLS